ncbi:hypothetical protein, partial [Staphylococcus aureus]
VTVTDRNGLRPGRYTFTKDNLRSFLNPWTSS